MTIENIKSLIILQNPTFMEKILLKNAEDVKDAINLFEIEWEKEIKEEIKKFLKIKLKLRYQY